MITRHDSRRGGNLRLRDEPAPQAGIDLEGDRFAMVPGRVSPADVADLRHELTERTVVGLHPAGFFDG